MQLDEIVKTSAITLRDVGNQASRNIKTFGKFNSHHEIYGVLMEELEEYLEQLRQHGTHQFFDTNELIDIAAVAVHAAIQIRHYGDVKR